MDAKNLDLLARIPIFAGEDREALKSALADCAIASYQDDQVICRHGEYDENCHVVLSGRVVVALPEKGAGREKRFTLEAGEVFGEIAAMSGAPRTADISAVSSAVILSISRNTMFKLLDGFPAIKARMDALYRERALKSHLLTIPMFAGIPGDFLDSLAERVGLRSYKKGDVIFRQGDEAEAFYLIRYGFVKVSAVSQGKEKVLAYLKEGHAFGEMALLRGGERRMATVTAINRVEILFVPAEDFRKLILNYPSVRRSLEMAAEKRVERNVQIDKDVNLANAIKASIETGMIQTKALLIMDTTKCVQCDSCVEACAVLHGGKSRLVRNGVRVNNFLFIPTSCRSCEDPTCMSKCPTGAITRDSGGEIYHKDICIGCGNCAANCPYGNITIAENGEAGGWKKWLAGVIAAFGASAQDPQAMAKFNFPGDRDSAGRPPSQRLPGDRDNVDRRADNPAKKIPKKKRQAVKCDMCREHTQMGCVYNCPTGAAQRVDPVVFFSDLASVG